MKIHIRCFRGYSVSEVLYDYVFFFSQFEYAVISSVDSSFNVSSFIFTEGVSGISLGNSAVVNLPELLRIAKEEYFNGFDEVWFTNTFPVTEVPWMTAEPPYKINPDTVEESQHPLLTGPNDWIFEEFDAEQDLPPLEMLSQTHMDWFQNSEYLLGIGDGNGLLCVYKDPIILPWQ